MSYEGEGDILLRRSSDLQLFRVSLDIFTEDDQAFVKNNFPPDHKKLPEFPRPLNDRALAINAKAIDDLVISKLRSYNQRENKIAGDEVFLRRAYLKIMGRIPTLSETKDFLDDKDKTGKRKNLIDKLLLTEGYVSNWFHYWADVLRAKDNLGNRVSGKPYIDYIKNFIATNKPYDDWVREMLSSSGNMWERGNGGIGYYARDRGMPLDNMSNTVKIFLGTSLECAMCHNHPFDRWTQKQFYEMAAFTHGVGNVQLRGQENLNIMNRLARAEQRRIEQGDDPRTARRVRDAARDISDIMLTGLSSTGTGKINLPYDYQYDNAQPSEQVKASTIFGLAIELDEDLEEKSPRSSYASWVASDSNPRFTTVIVNRLWKKTFGISLIEPLDNMFDDTMATHPKLQLHLEKVMVALDYDLKEFLRVLYNTKTFQRLAPARDILARDAKDTSMPEDVKWVIAGPYPDNPSRKSVPYFYQGPQVERMTGEQLWDSLITLNYPNPDSRKIKPRQDHYANFEKYSTMTGEELFDLVMERTGLRSEPGAATPTPANNPAEMSPKLGEPINTECPLKPGRSIDPSLKALNEKGETIGFCCRSCLNRFKSSQPTPTALTQPSTPKLSNPVNIDCPLKPGRPIDPSLLAINENGETIGFCCQNCLNKFKAEMNQKKMASSNSSSQEYVNFVRDRNSVRASEVGSPARAGHLIREFGGSDREQIENSHKQASVTQVLNLLNGYVEERLLKNREAEVLLNINKTKSSHLMIENAFLSILNRKPTTKEISDFTPLVSGKTAQAAHDLVWVLVNSHEFMFVQ